MSDPIYVAGVGSVVSQRDLGHGHCIVDMNCGGKIAGVELIPTQPLPLVQPSELIENEYYWQRFVTNGSWSIYAGFVISGRRLKPVEIRGPIPPPEEMR